MDLATYRVTAPTAVSPATAAAGATAATRAPAPRRQNATIATTDRLAAALPKVGSSAAVAPLATPASHDLAWLAGGIAVTVGLAAVGRRLGACNASVEALAFEKTVGTGIGGGVGALVTYVAKGAVDHDLGLP